MDGAMTFTPEMLAALQGLAQMPGAPGIGGMPDMAQFALQNSAHAQGPGIPGLTPGAAVPPKETPFPIDAALLAGLGAAGMGLRTGASRPPAPTGSLPVASQAGRGLQAAPFALPRGR